MDTGLRHNIVNGIYVPFFVTQEIYEDTLKRVPVYDGDIIISTFPKSGTTLTQYLVYLLIHGDIPEGAKLTQVVPWFDAHKINASFLPATNRIFKTHLRWQDMFTFKNQRIKHIYIARNCKDVCVSMYYHTRAYSGVNRSAKNFFRFFCDFFLIYS